LLVLLIALYVFIPSVSYAYLDPGSGAVLINLLIAGVATLIYSLKGVFFRLLGRKHPQNNTIATECQIAILSEGKQYWATFEPVVKGFVALGVKFRYYTLDVEDPALLIENEFMDSRFLGFGAWKFSKAGSIRAEYLICTTPNIGCKGYPIRKSPNVQNLIHIFHSINDLSMYKIGSLDYYDMVVMVGEFQTASIREIEKKRNLKPKQLIPLGLPYLDVYSKNKQDRTKTEKVQTILIGSSWGSKGLLHHYGTGFIAQLANLGYHIIVRPHPQSMVSENEMIEKCKQQLATFTNVVWDTQVSPSEAMNKADLLISDTSSLRYDFAFIYEKPVITLDIPLASMPGYERDELSLIWSDKAAAKIGYVLADAELDSLSEYVVRVCQNNWTDRIKQFREETVVNFGQSGLVIARYFADKATSKLG